MIWIEKETGIERGMERGIEIERGMERGMEKKMGIGAATSRWRH